jgi:hypothetical protein
VDDGDVRATPRTADTVIGARQPTAAPAADEVGFAGRSSVVSILGAEDVLFERG